MTEEELMERKHSLATEKRLTALHKGLSNEYKLAVALDEEKLANQLQAALWTLGAAIVTVARKQTSL